MAASDLATLSAVRAWASVANTASDAQLQGLITSVSRAIYSAMQRPSILPASFTEILDGTGGSRIQLKNWPVIAVSAVTDGLTSIAPATSAVSPGFVLEAVDPTPPGRQANVTYRCGRFCRGSQNIAISYTAGYQVTETQTIAGGALTASAPYGAWASNRGVTYASNGVALSLVTGAPAQGQYALGSTPGAYTFNAADNGASVILTYGFIPADLSQACVEWVAQRFKSQTYIGLRSKSLGGQESTTYDTGVMPASVGAMIQPYKRVAIC